MSGRDPDERIVLPLDPDEALRALLAVDPDSDPEPIGPGDAPVVPDQDADDK